MNTAETFLKPDGWVVKEHVVLLKFYQSGLKGRGYDAKKEPDVEVTCVQSELSILYPFEIVVQTERQIVSGTNGYNSASHTGSLLPKARVDL